MLSLFPVTTDDRPPGRLELMTTFVCYSQFLAAFGAAGSQHSTTIRGRHSLHKAMFVAALALRGLKCSFHCSIILCPTRERFVFSCRKSVQNYYKKMNPPNFPSKKSKNNSFLLLLGINTCHLRPKSAGISPHCWVSHLSTWVVVGFSCSHFSAALTASSRSWLSRVHCR